MSRRFSRPKLGYLVALLFFASPAVASADSTTVTVVAAGVPQADTQLRVNTRLMGSTDGAGNKTLSNIWPGEVIQATRDYDGNSSDPCNAPEQEGVEVTVPNPVPAAITITVPDANTSATYQSQLGSSERKFVGLVNQLRAQQNPPLPPVYVSTTLEDAVNRYVGLIPQTYNPNPPVNPHCLLSGFFTRDINSGFPMPANASGGEIISWGTYAASTAFQTFENSPPHRAIMLLSQADAIGVAVDGGVWVADFAYVNPNDPYVARAQMTTDAGNPNLPEDNLAPGQKEGAEEESENGFGDSGLRFKRLRVRGHQLRVTLTLAREAKSQGRVVLIARQQRRRRSLALGPGLEARVKLGRGAWSLQAKFIPKANGDYLGSAITRRLQIPKPRKRVRA